jgi:PAS domain S-box-containing protein
MPNRKTAILPKDTNEAQYSLATLFEQSPLGVLIVEKEGSVSYANSTAIAMLKLKADSAHGFWTTNQAWQYLDAYSQPVSQDELPIATTFRSQKAQANKMMGIKEGELVKWLTVNTTPFFFPDGSVEKVLVYCKDITEDRQKQLLVEQNEDNLRTVLDLSDDGYVIVSDTREILMCNKLVTRLLQLSAKIELEEGANLIDLLPASQKADVDKNIELALNNQFVSKEYAIKTSKKKEKWLKVSFLPQDKSKGRVIIEVEDSSRQKELEHKLDGANEELIEMMNTSLKSFFILDEDYRIIQYNKNAENSVNLFFNKKPKKNEQILGYVFPNYIERFKRNVKLAVEGRRTKEEIEQEVEMGLVFHFEMEFFPSMNKRSKRHNVGFSYINITEKKMTRQILLKSVSEINKYKGALYDTAALLVVNRENEITDMSEAFCMLLEQSRNEILGKNVGLLFADAPQKEKCRQLAQEATQVGVTQHAEMELCYKGGKAKKVFLSVFPVKDDVGKVGELIFVFK